MKHVNCLVVDDEPASREILERYINDFPSLIRVKSCRNAFEAIEVLGDNSIDLLFLDINMPGLSGMKFYKSLDRPPFVIFTTAYPEFAVEGFEVGAVDYLLKPFPFERFVKAVNKAIEAIQSKTTQPSSGDFILLKADKRINKVNIQEIIHLEAIGDYVKVRYADKSIVVHSTFQDLLEQLPDETIVRIHKSHAVSLNFVEAVEGNMVLIKTLQLPIGPSYKDSFMERFT